MTVVGRIMYRCCCCCFVIIVDIIFVVVANFVGDCIALISAWIMNPIVVVVVVIATLFLSYYPCS